MTSYRDVLRAHQDAVNRLNVYPVPDGDTGTNMALTLESVVSTLGAAAETTAEMAGACQAISRGSLMGARGNSGVILSQVLRGVCDVCRDVDSVGPDDMARALRAASVAADKSVSRPVEGTILTVVRAAAQGAEEASSRGETLAHVVEAARSTAADALDRTPEQLPVLKEAGVVDAGGLGFLLFLDALLQVACGRPLPEPPATATVSVDTSSAPAEAGGVGSRYEVMFFLESPDQAVPAFRQAWEGIGDSIVVAGGEGLWNCHIHTDDIGAAIEAALDRGRPRDIRVTDLQEQVAEERWVREATAAEDGEDTEDGEDIEGQAPIEAAPAQKVPTAVVAVGSGKGLDAMFRSLGAHGVVTGGQSMNPSTAEILAAVEAAPADDVVVLPNNKNIVPVAEQVDGLTAKRVRVVPTHAVGEGLAALLEYHPQASAEDSVSAMTAAANRVAWGEVTQAVRSSSCQAGPIGEGDWLGISKRRIEAVAPTVAEAATGLLDTLVTEEHEIVTLIQGEGASDADTGRITRWLEDHHPGLSAEVHHGGQPLYPYLLSVE